MLTVGAGVVVILRCFKPGDEKFAANCVAALLSTTRRKWSCQPKWQIGHAVESSCDAAGLSWVSMYSAFVGSVLFILKLAVSLPYRWFVEIASLVEVLRM